MPFTHLHVHTEFSLLDGGSDCEHLAERAAALGMTSLAMTDHNSLTGAVRFIEACKSYSIRPILGCELTMEDDSHLTLLARNRSGYSILCRLVTLAYEIGGRHTPTLPWTALAPATGGLFCLTGCHKGKLAALIRNHRYDEAQDFVRELIRWFGPENCYVELQLDFTPGTLSVARELADLAKHVGIGTLATNNVHYATADDSITHEVLCCIATKTTVNERHPDRPLNSERFLKSHAEMAELFAWCPQAVENTAVIAMQCVNPLPAGEEITPRYIVPDGYKCATSYLRHLTLKGAAARYGRLTRRVRARLDYELEIIDRLGFNDYFLMVWSVVLWARRHSIRCTGRGSAADSCVAYSLRLTDVDVLESDLPFARFLCEGKVPDIDMDFDSARRDEVFQHILERYGEQNAAMVCAYNTFRAKSAVRDIGKALALPDTMLDFLSKHLSHFVDADGIERAFERLAELRPHQHMKDRFKLLFSLCAKIANFPRHLQTHSSGIVISRVRLDTLAPIQSSAKGLVRILHLDKDDAEAIGLIKFDVLGLRILSAISDASDDIRRYNPSFSYERIALDDPDTYAMLRAGDGVGAFQFESAAQINLALRCMITNIQDLTAAVALIRPGPVKGNAVQRFIAARNGLTRPHYPHPCLEPILRRTLGVIIFQEQVVSILAVMMGISEGEADRFRKSLSKHMRRGTMEEPKVQFIERTIDRHPDIGQERAEFLWTQLESWGGYGFTEGHGRSFALTGYKTANLSLHHPAAYFAGLMSNQPMGFYPINSLAGEARRRGVTILPVDINRSLLKCCAEEENTIRLGLGLVSELREEDVVGILAARQERLFASLLDFAVRVPLHLHRMENLILCGAFDELHPHRRGLTWRLEETMAQALLYRACHQDPQARFTFDNPAFLPTPVAWDIEDFSAWDKFLWSWSLTGATAECHVFTHLRDHLAARGVHSTYDAKNSAPGTRVTVAGINIQPHRPPTKSGEPILFTSIEDEHGLLQATVVGDAIARTTATFLTAQVVVVRGAIVQSGRGVYLLVDKARPLRMQEWVKDASGLAAAPPPRRTYPGTVLTASAV